jgi:hypothetical protein
VGEAAAEGMIWIEGGTFLMESVRTHILISSTPALEGR